MARAYKLTDWETLDPLIDQDVAQGMTLKNIATKYGIGKSALIMHRLKRKPTNAFTAPGETMTEDVVEGTPNQMDLDADTPTTVVDNDPLVRTYHQERGVVWSTEPMGFQPLPSGMAARIQPFHDLAAEVEAALRSSITHFGVIYPVVKDQYGRFLDGHQRARIADEEQVRYQMQIRVVTDDAEALAIAKTLNTERRHLGEVERRQFAFSLRQEGLSYREIASHTGTSHVQAMTDVKTYADDLASQGVQEPATPKHVPADVPAENDEPVVSTYQSVIVEMPEPPAPTPKLPETITDRHGRRHPATRQRPPKQQTPSTPVEEGTTAERWYSRLLHEFKQLDQKIEAFQSDGGVSVLGRQLSAGMRDALLGEMRGQAKRLRDMADYLETIT